MYSTIFRLMNIEYTFFTKLKHDFYEILLCRIIIYKDIKASPPSHFFSPHCAAIWHNKNTNYNNYLFEYVLYKFPKSELIITRSSINL